MCSLVFLECIDPWLSVCLLCRSWMLSSCVHGPPSLSVIRLPLLRCFVKLCHHSWMKSYFVNLITVDCGWCGNGFEQIIVRTTFKTSYPLIQIVLSLRSQIHSSSYFRGQTRLSCFINLVAKLGAIWVTVTWLCITRPVICTADENFHWIKCYYHAIIITFSIKKNYITFHWVTIEMWYCGSMVFSYTFTQPIYTLCSYS